MLRRLPISLRFDDDDSDFYYGFIEQKKNDRELSSLILDLLHVYYENEEVRNIVDDYVISKSPYMHIHEQLERIALEHSRQSVSTHMLNDFNDNARRKVSETPEPVKEEKKENKQSIDNEPLLLEAAMDKLSPMIEQKITELFSKFMSNAEVTPEMVKDVSNGVEESIKEEVVSRPQPQSVIPPKKEVPSVAKSMESVKSDSVTETKRPAKPASFGKLLGSVR